LNSSRPMITCSERPLWLIFSWKNQGRHSESAFSTACWRCAPKHLLCDYVLVYNSCVGRKRLTYLLVKDSTVCIVYQTSRPSCMKPVQADMHKMISMSSTYRLTESHAWQPYITFAKTV